MFRYSHESQENRSRFNTMVCFQVRCLDGFSRFVAIGTLDLSGNQLSWTELSKIQHLHILDLRLHGNTQLERDPYCESHGLAFSWAHLWYYFTCCSLIVDNVNCSVMPRLNISKSYCVEHWPIYGYGLW